jgi:hypothetical protein
VKGIQRIDEIAGSTTSSATRRRTVDGRQLPHIEVKVKRGGVEHSRQGYVVPTNTSSPVLS